MTEPTPHKKKTISFRTGTMSKFPVLIRLNPLPHLPILGCTNLAGYKDNYDVKKRYGQMGIQLSD